MKAADLLVEFYDASEDHLGIAKKSQTRRPRLTMVHLEKLRHSRDAARYDKLKHLEFLPDMYGQTAQPGM